MMLAASAAAPLFAQAPVTPSTPAVAAPPKDISTELEALLKTHSVPGLAALVVRGDGTIEFEGVAGVRARGSEPRITLNDQFHLGSCTKAMTATLAAILVQEGTLSWETTLADAFPQEFASADPGSNAPNPEWKSVTLANLVTNRSGVPSDLSANGLWGSLFRFKGTGPESRHVLLTGILVREPEFPAGTKFLYSNAGFALAGHMAETKTAVAYESLIADKLFTPLGITSAGFGAPGTVPDANAKEDESHIDQPRGHDDDGKPVPPGPRSDNPQAIAPAGTLHMKLRDWSKFAALHIRGARGELLPSDPLQAEGFTFLHTPFATDDKAPSTPPITDGYAAGWRVTSRPWARQSPIDGSSPRVLTHAGSNTMWFCVVWIAPDRDFAILAATNQGGDAGTKATDAAAALLVGAMKPK